MPGRRGSKQEVNYSRDLTAGLDTSNPAHQLPLGVSPQCQNVVFDDAGVKKRGGFRPLNRRHPRHSSVVNEGYRVEGRYFDAAGSSTGDTTYLTVPGALYADYRAAINDFGGKYTVEFFFRIDNLDTTHGLHGRNSGETGFPTDGTNPLYSNSSGNQNAPFTIKYRPIISQGPVKKTIVNPTTDARESGPGANTWRTAFPGPWGPPGSTPYGCPFAVYLYNSAGTWQLRAMLHYISEASPLWRTATITSSLTMVKGRLYHCVFSVDLIDNDTAYLRVGPYDNDGSSPTYTTDTFDLTQSGSFTQVAPAGIGKNPLQVFDMPQALIDFSGATNGTSATTNIAPGIEDGSQAVRGGYFAHVKRFEGAIEDIAIWGKAMASAADTTFDRGYTLDETTADDTLGFHWSMRKDGQGYVKETTGKGNHLFFSPEVPIFDETSGNVQSGRKTGSLWFNGLTSYAMVDLDQQRNNNTTQYVQDSLGYSRPDLGNTNWQYLDEEYLPAPYFQTNPAGTYPRLGALQTVSPGRAAFWKQLQTGTTVRGHGMRIELVPGSVHEPFEMVIAEIHTVMRIVIDTEGKFRVYARDFTVAAGGENQYDSTNFCQSTIEAVPGRRYVISAIRRGTTLSLYINDKLDDTATLSAASVDARSHENCNPPHGITLGMGARKYSSNKILGNNSPVSGADQEELHFRPDFEGAYARPNQLSTDSRSGYCGHIEQFSILVADGGKDLPVVLDTREDNFRAATVKHWWNPVSTDKSDQATLAGKNYDLPPEINADHLTDFSGHLRHSGLIQVRYALDSDAGTSLSTDRTTGDTFREVTLDARDGGHDSIGRALVYFYHTLAHYVLTEDDVDSVTIGRHSRGIEVWTDPDTTTSGLGRSTAQPDNTRGVYEKQSFIQDRLGALGPLLLRSIEPDILSDAQRREASETATAWSYESKFFTHRMKPYYFRSTKELQPKWKPGIVYPRPATNPIDLVTSWQHQQSDEKFTIVSSGRTVYWLKPPWRGDSPFVEASPTSIWSFAQPDDYLELIGSDRFTGITEKNIWRIQSVTAGNPTRITIYCGFESGFAPSEVPNSVTGSGFTGALTVLNGAQDVSIGGVGASHVDVNVDTSALSFDSDDWDTAYVEHNTGALWNRITVDFWVKPLRLDGNRMIVARGSINNQLWNYLIGTTSGSLWIAGSADTKASAWAYQEWDHVNDVPYSSLRVNEWNYVVVQMGSDPASPSNEGVSAWINGQPVGLTLITNPVTYDQLNSGVVPDAKVAGAIFLLGLPQGKKTIQLKPSAAAQQEWEFDSCAALLSSFRIRTNTTLSGNYPKLLARPSDTECTSMLYPFNEGEGNVASDQSQFALANAAVFLEDLVPIGQTEDIGEGARYDSAVYRDRLYISNGRSKVKEVEFRRLTHPEGPFHMHDAGMRAGKIASDSGHVVRYFDASPTFGGIDVGAMDLAVFQQGIYQCYVSFLDDTGLRESEPVLFFQDEIAPKSFTATYDTTANPPPGPSDFAIDSASVGVGIPRLIFSDSLATSWDLSGITGGQNIIFRIQSGGVDSGYVWGHLRNTREIYDLRLEDGTSWDDFVSSLTLSSGVTEATFTIYPTSVQLVGIPRGEEGQVAGRRFYLSATGGGGALFHSDLNNNISAEYTLYGPAQPGGLGVEIGRRLQPPRARHLAVGAGSMFYGNLPGLPAGNNQFAWSDGEDPTYVPFTQFVTIDSRDGKAITSMYANLGRLYLHKRDSMFQLLIRGGGSLDNAQVVAASLQPVDESTGLAGGVALWNNQFMGASERGVYSLPPSGVGPRYVGEPLEGDWDSIPKRDEDFLVMYGAQYRRSNQYWLSLRTTQGTSSDRIYVLQNTGAWSRWQVPAHTYMAEIQNPVSQQPEVVLGTSSGQVLAYDDSITVDGHPDVDVTLGSPILRISPITGNVVLTSTQLTYDYLTAGTTFFDIIGDGLRGLLVTIVYTDSNGDAFAEVRQILRSDAGVTTSFYWLNPLSGVGALTPVSFVIGPIVATWNTGWLQLPGQMPGDTIDVGGIDIEFEPQDGVSLLLLHAAANTWASSTTASNRAFPTGSATTTTFVMTDGFISQPVDTRHNGKGRYFRMQLGTLEIRDPFHVTGLGFRGFTEGKGTFPS